MTRTKRHADPRVPGDLITPDHHDYDDARPFGTARSTDDPG